jgi:iron-sulfur cluster assembly protein
MLMLSENATRVINSLGDRPEYPDGTGVRIGQADDGTEQLAITPATTPQPADQVVEADGARVYLDPSAAEILEDKVLDARINPEGRVEFLLALQ